MKKNFVEELRWRGMIQDIMPGTEELVQKEVVTAYVGIDPTADSLHIGHLVSVMLLKHLQACGHKPLALVGGATGMIGDPSGKSEERNLLSEHVLTKNIKGISAQLERFLDFDCGELSAEIVNNYDWFKEMNFLHFLRDVGKHLTVNYMMSKDSVQKRLETGLSFTEFTYQLVQGFDFLHLYTNKNCKLQMGGSDQWGNIVTGSELIRRKVSGEVFALTTPLITKADGSKFGKSEGGNVWLDPDKTSAYHFYQFWINVSDEDASKYIRIFTMMEKEEIETLEAEHLQAPHLRLLQKKLAYQVTVMVHGEEACEQSIAATDILFGKGDAALLASLTDKMIETVFEGVPQYEVPRHILGAGISAIDLLGGQAPVFPSKSEARRTIQGGGVSVNKQKIDADTSFNASSLINNRFLLVQKGKKNYYLIKSNA